MTLAAVVTSIVMRGNGAASRFRSLTSRAVSGLGLTAG